MYPPISITATVGSMKRKKKPLSTTGVKRAATITGRVIVKRQPSGRKMSGRGGVNKVKTDAVKMSPVCTNCRERHLKCSGPPICTRCRNETAECIFVPSRRGQRPQRDRTPTPDPQSSASTQPRWPRILPSSSTSGLELPDRAGRAQYVRSPAPGLVSRSASPNLTLSHHFIDLAYQHDLVSYSFVLPKQLLLQSLTRTEVQCLKVVIEYIGMAHDRTNRASYSDQIERMLFSQQFALNAYTVQAYVLLAIKLSARQDTRVVQCLRWASTFATHIGMNRSNFAQLHSGGSLEQEESWSRTFTVLTQLCHTWSVNVTTSSLAPTQDYDPSSRRSSIHPAPAYVPSESSSRRASMPQVRHQPTTLPDWQNSYQAIPWTLPSQAHDELPSAYSGMVLQQTRSNPVALETMHYPPTSASELRRMSFDPNAAYLSQLPRTTGG